MKRAQKSLSLNLYTFKFSGGFCYTLFHSKDRPYIVCPQKVVEILSLWWKFELIIPTHSEKFSFWPFLGHLLEFLGNALCHPWDTPCILNSKKALQTLSAWSISSCSGVVLIVFLGGFWRSRGLNVAWGKKNTKS